MTKAINDINELMLGDIVRYGVNGDYAQVRQCIHGCKYYAMVSWQDESILDAAALPIAYDTDIDYITCCG